MACALSALPPHPNNASFSPLHSAPPSARSSSPPPLKGERLPCAPNISPGRAIFSPRACANMPAARPYARLPANHFSWPSFLCHAVKSLPAPVCLRSSPFLPLGFSLSRLFSQSALAKFIGFLSAKFLPLFIGAPQSRFVCPGRFSCAASFQANLCPLVFPFPSSG